MANIKKIRRDDIIIELDKDRKLKFTLNSFAKIEEKYGSVDNGMAAFNDNSIKDILFFLWTGLMHEDRELTEETIADSIDYRDISYVMELVTEALSADQPNEPIITDDKESESIVPN